MKINGKTNGFSPITIEITLDSKSEARELYNLFNYMPIMEAAKIPDSFFIDCVEALSVYRDEKSFYEFIERLKKEMDNDQRNK